MTVPQWCDLHWAAVRQSLEAGEVPINGLMVSLELMVMWLAEKTDGMGDLGHAGTQQMNLMLARDSPLCCHFGDAELGRVFVKCVLPERYRHLPPAEGHMRHLEDEGGEDDV